MIAEEPMSWAIWRLSAVEAGGAFNVGFFNPERLLWNHRNVSWGSRAVPHP